MSAQESHHAIASMRIRTGEEVILFDGAGQEAAGQVTRVNRRRLSVDVTHISRHPFDAPRRVTLALAMPRAHRQGYLIEKCTELGVAAIWPIITDRGVARPGEQAIEKWLRRAIEAAKQAQRRWIPNIAGPMTFAESIARIGEFYAAGWTDVAPSATPLVDFLHTLPESSSALVWVGPEGGWTDAERRLAIEAGAIRIRLSPTVLRTETAAVVVCALAALV